MAIKVYKNTTKMAEKNNEILYFSLFYQLLNKIIQIKLKIKKIGKIKK